MSRTLGDPEFKAAGLVVAEPEVAVVPLQRGRDSFLIAASDGLWSAVGDQQAVDEAARVLEEVRGVGGSRREGRGGEARGPRRGRCTGADGLERGTGMASRCKGGEGPALFRFQSAGLTVAAVPAVPCRCSTRTCRCSTAPRAPPRPPASCSSWRWTRDPPTT